MENSTHNVKIADLSPEQREIYETEVKYWTYYGEKNIGKFMSLFTKDVLGWSEEIGLNPVGYEAIRQGVLDKFKTMKDGSFEFTINDPLPLVEVICHESRGCIMYSVKICFETDGHPSKEIKAIVCYLHNYVKQNGPWLISNGMNFNLPHTATPKESVSLPIMHWPI